MLDQKTASSMFLAQPRRALVAGVLVASLTFSSKVLANEPALASRKQQDPAAIVRQVERGFFKPAWDANGCMMLPDNGLLNPTAELTAVGVFAGTPIRGLRGALDLDGIDPSQFESLEDIQNALAEVLGSRGLDEGDSYGPSHHVDFYDWDDDGDLDAFVGLKSAFDAPADPTPMRGPLGDVYGFGSLVFFENVTGEDSSPFPDDHTYFRPIVDGTGPLGEFLDFGVERGLGPGYIGSPAPAIQDLDQDGFPELYVGDGEGHVRRYHLPGELPPRGALAYDPDTAQYDAEDFEYLREAPLDTRGGVPLDALDVGENAVPAFFDVDGDGQLELFVGRKTEDALRGVTLGYEPIYMYRQSDAFILDRGAEPPLLWEKSDPVENPFFEAEVFGFTAPSFVDIDDDGDTDAFVGAKSGLHYFENITNEVRGGSGTVFEQRFGLDHPLLGAQSLLGGTSPAFADIDGDGDFDYFAGAKTIDFVENRGTAADPAFLDMGMSPEYVDLDDDGDLDVLAGGKLLQPIETEKTDRGIVSTGRAALVYFENIGSDTVPVWERRLGESSPVDGLLDGAELDEGFPFIAADTVDIDDDGDFDLFVGTKSQGILFFRNDGGPGFPMFTQEESPFADYTEPELRGEEPEGGYFADPDPFFVDLDGDGDFDAVIGDKGDPPTDPDEMRGLGVGSRLRYFENVTGEPARGSGPVFEERFDGDNPFSLIEKGADAPWLVDYDFDGDYDLFFGSKDLGVVLYARNDGDAENPMFDDLETAFYLARLNEIAEDFTEPLSRGGDPWQEGEEFPGAGWLSLFEPGFPAVVDIDADGDHDGFIGGTGRNEAFRGQGGLDVDPLTIVTSETGETADISVALAAKPIGNVNVDVSVSDATEASLSDTSLVFTPDDWDTPQIVTVTGEDDALVDGDIPYQVIFRSFPEGDEVRGGEPPCAEVVVDGINADEEARSAVLTATKEVFGGSSDPGDVITYEIVLTNVSGVAQPDLMGPEFEDVLPPELLLLTADATAGTASTSGNTVSWNGSVAPGGSVVITITAEILADPGTVIVNQGVASFDGEPDGMNNDSSVLSDDPNEPGIADETVFVVGGPLQGQNPLEIPTMSQVGQWAMGALLALFALVGISRNRP